MLHRRIKTNRLKLRMIDSREYSSELKNDYEQKQKPIKSAWRKNDNGRGRKSMLRMLHLCK